MSEKPKNNSSEVKFCVIMDMQERFFGYKKMVRKQWNISK